MKSLFLLMLLLILVACGRKDPSGNQRSEQGQGAAPPKAVFIEEGALTQLQEDSLLSRLVPSWSVAEVLANLPGAKVVKREAVPNRHIPHQTDTLLTIANGRSKLRFYRLPDKELLQYAMIKDLGLSFGGGLAVGVPVAALAQVVPPLSGKDTLPEHILLRGKPTPRSLKISLGNGAVQQIEFQGYVD